MLLNYAMSPAVKLANSALPLISSVAFDSIISTTENCSAKATQKNNNNNRIYDSLCGCRKFYSTSGWHLEVIS